MKAKAAPQKTTRPVAKRGPARVRKSEPSEAPKTKKPQVKPAVPKKPKQAPTVWDHLNSDEDET